MFFFAKTCIKPFDMRIQTRMFSLCFTVPGSSRDLKAEKITSTSVSLKWLAPEIDAGMEKYMVGLNSIICGGLTASVASATLLVLFVT